MVNSCEKYGRDAITLPHTVIYATLYEEYIDSCCLLVVAFEWAGTMTKMRQIYKETVYHKFTSFRTTCRKMNLEVIFKLTSDPDTTTSKTLGQVF
jgi:hypothetical protein